MSGLTGFSAVTRRLVKDRAGQQGDFTRCEYCGVWHKVVQIHHRRARQRSRNNRWDTNLPSNALVLCLKDHEWAESRREDALEVGVLLKQFQTPTAVPVKLWDGLHILNDDGSRTAVEEAA